jgi:hypothetical protein
VCCCVVVSRARGSDFSNSWHINITTPYICSYLGVTKLNMGLNNNQQVTYYKIKALDRSLEEISRRIGRQASRFPNTTFQEQTTHQEPTLREQAMLGELGTPTHRRSRITNPDRDVYLNRVVGRRTQRGLTWSRPSSLFWILWLPFCFFRWNKLVLRKRN